MKRVKDVKNVKGFKTHSWPRGLRTQGRLKASHYQNICETLGEHGCLERQSYKGLAHVIDHIGFVLDQIFRLKLEASDVRRTCIVQLIGLLA